MFKKLKDKTKEAASTAAASLTRSDSMNSLNSTNSTETSEMPSRMKLQVCLCKNTDKY